MANRIYVQVPAYRDPELAPTLEQLFDTANRPDRLVVAVAWQHGADEHALAPALRRRARLIAIPAAESRGCNWARLLLQRGWAGEEFTLFLDSHHRFVQGWDELSLDLLDERRRAGSLRPVLTGYLPPYEPNDDPDRRLQAVYDLDVTERCDGLVFRLEGHAASPSSEPVPARFVSLHYLFADGAFNRDVPMDPDVYFFADEVAIAVRAFSHGFDLWRPHVVLGWHLYDRSTRATHWGDHGGWSVERMRTLQRLRSLYSGELEGRFGLGPVRSISDYELYAGIRVVDPEPSTRQKDSLWNSHLARELTSRSATLTS